MPTLQIITPKAKKGLEIIRPLLRSPELPRVKQLYPTARW